ncbi:hypothetical protein ACIG5E_28590 [Kitasatospora sp. NPDC053057]
MLRAGPGRAEAVTRTTTPVPASIRPTSRHPKRSELGMVTAPTR